MPDESRRKRLLVNADDFGLHPAVNRGIIRAHREGVLSSASVMASGNAFEEAICLARQNPGLDIGAHLTLVGAKPVSPPDLIPSLLEPGGSFPEHHSAFLRRLLSGRINWSETALELEGQIEKVVRAGLPVTHLDSHQHLHVLPPLLKIVLNLARRYGGLAVRLPLETRLPPGTIRAAGGIRRWPQWKTLSWAARLARPRYRNLQIPFPRHCFGMFASGSLNETLLIAILRFLPEGVSEIICHPGENDPGLGERFPWGYRWQQEMEALLSPRVRSALQEEDIELIGFRQLWAG
ncbi:MAG: ChbG/HpnK family deacetylase [Armatimonadetes bacterium]|nr:ChbG/HpnK family deacetylase [Armatimonadota bacterium]